MKCPLFKSGLGARCLPGGRHEWLPEGRRGADDEDPRSDFASDGEEDYVVAGSGNHGDQRAVRPGGRRWHGRYKEVGYDGLLDRRVGKPSLKRVPLAVVEQVFTLYREKYFDLNVRHFHEKLQQEH